MTTIWSGISIWGETFPTSTTVPPRVQASIAVRTGAVAPTASKTTSAPSVSGVDVPKRAAFTPASFPATNVSVAPSERAWTSRPSSRSIAAILGTP